jgi:hypothetical protein
VGVPNFLFSSSLLRGDLFEAPWIFQAEYRQFEPAHPLSSDDDQTTALGFPPGAISFAGRDFPGSRQIPQAPASNHL